MSAFHIYGVQTRNTERIYGRVRSQDTPSTQYPREHYVVYMQREKWAVNAT